VNTSKSPAAGENAASPGSGRHTPGPWIRSIGGYQVLTGDSWNTICVFHEGAGEKWKDHRLAEHEDGRGAVDREANAALVAAAPDLLEAARSSMSLLDDAIRSGEVSQLQANQAWSKCKAAIDKALGQEP